MDLFVHISHVLLGDGQLGRGLEAGDPLLGRGEGAVDLGREAVLAFDGEGLDGEPGEELEDVGGGGVAKLW